MFLPLMGSRVANSSLTCFVFTLILFTGIAHAEFKHAWVIEYKGKVSIVLGTDHGIMVRPEDFPVQLLDTISKARKVLLEAYPIDHNESEHKNTENILLPRRDSLKKMLSPGALSALRTLLSPERYEQALLLKPGVVAFLIQSEIKKQMDNHMKDFMRLSERALTDEEAALHVERFYLPFQPSEAVSEMISSIVEEDQDVMDYLLAETEAESEDHEFTGVDRLVAHIAEQSHRDISGLDVSEPKPTDLQLMIELVDASDLNRHLMSAAERIDAKLGAIYFLENLISEKMFLVWNKRLYFSDLSTEEFVQDIESRYEGLHGDLEVMPGLEKFNRYDRERHKFWLQTIAEEAKKGGAFVAIGLGHLIKRSDDREPSLLDSLRQLGFTVSAWSNQHPCSDYLQ